MIGKDIVKAKKFLENGQLVGIPTETVYGLAGNALAEDAVLAIFSTKMRPQFNPLIIHVAEINHIPRYVSHFPTKALKLADRFMPGPLTLLLPKKEIVPDLVTAGSPKVAIRIPNHVLTRALLASLDFPLAAPSANPFGYISPTTAQHVENQLGDKIPYILDGGECEVGLESTIIGFNDTNEAVLHRLGGLSVEEIEDCLGEKVILNIQHGPKPETSGQLLSHYAPTTPLLLGKIPIFIKEYGTDKAGALTFQSLIPEIFPENQIVLSKNGNMEEAAKRLFGALRELDAKNLRVIYAEEVPDIGLGKAINDRLRRARVENKLLGK